MGGDVLYLLGSLARQPKAQQGLHFTQGRIGLAASLRCPRGAGTVLTPTWPGSLGWGSSMV